MTPTSAQSGLLLIAGLFLLLLIIAGILWALERRHMEELMRRAGLSYIGQIPNFDVDAYLQDLFRNLGYRVEEVPKREELAADLVLTDGTGRRVAVLARHFEERVTEEAIQNLVIDAVELQCQERLVVSIDGFTGGARRLAAQTGTHLWDLKRLAEAMERATQAAIAAAVDRTGGLHGPAPHQPAQAAVEPSPFAPRGPACPICGSPMRPRLALGREIWLCTRFPRCNGARSRED